MAANQIYPGAPLANIANFLKFATAGQFRLLTEEQADILELRLEEAYDKMNDVEGQREKIYAEIILKKIKHLREGN